MAYRGWICRYTTNGIIRDTDKTARNRNGCYRMFYAEGRDDLTVTVVIEKQ